MNAVKFSRRATQLVAGDVIEGPDLIKRVRVRAVRRPLGTLEADRGIEVDIDDLRGFDHGHGTITLPEDALVWVYPNR